MPTRKTSSSLALLFVVWCTSDASAARSCAERAHAMRNRGLANVLRCSTDARARGGDTATCLDRVRANLASFAASAPGCTVDAPFVAGAIDRCATAIMTAIPGTGACPARKIRAVRASLRNASRKTGDDHGGMCRTFARAGGCAGDCLAIANTLATCWGDDAQPPPQRALPPAAPDDRIVVLGTYEADAIATVTVAGQDEVTETGRVVVSPGTTPLYVVIASYEHIIWRFEGDVSRVRQVVLAGDGASGVTGIPADRVADVTESGDNVGYFYEADSAEARQARAALEAALGRHVDVFAGAYSVGTLTVPAGTVEPSDGPSTVPPGFDPAVYVDLGLRFNPGGVVQIDPVSVVSTPPAATYDVLPQGFGLAHLVATGDLEVLDDSFLYTFRIVQPIERFPAGLYGAHLVRFVLGSGVPLPAGNPGHSCVVSEDTGLPVANEVICDAIFGG